MTSKNWIKLFSPFTKENHTPLWNKNTEKPYLFSLKTEYKFANYQDKVFSKQKLESFMFEVQQECKKPVQVMDPII